MKMKRLKMSFDFFATSARKISVLVEMFLAQKSEIT